MNASFYLGVSLPQNIRDKLDKTNLFPEISPAVQQPYAHIDAFYMDGTPVAYDPGVIYPCYAAWYLGVPIPNAYLQVQNGYKQAAAKAALEWLCKLLPNAEADTRHTNGESFQANVGGTDLNFCFPCMTLSYSEPVVGTLAGHPCLAAVIPYPDTSDNKEDWESGTIPYYVEVQARLLLWCWEQSYQLKRRYRVPDRVFVVRITGNTPTDITVRTVLQDQTMEQRIVSRLAKEIAKATTARISPLERVKIRPQCTWKERSQAEWDAAYHTDNADFYKLVCDYMKISTFRKTKEAESKQIKNEMDAIAISLADQLGNDKLTGSVANSTNTIMYSVAHTLKRYSPPTVSAQMVRQFYPNCADAIHTDITPRGRITIEAR